MNGLDEPREITSRQQKHVVNNVIRGRDLSIAVVPGEFEHFEQVERSIDVAFGKALLYEGSTFVSTLFASNGHVASSHRSGLGGTTLCRHDSERPAARY